MEHWVDSLCWQQLEFVGDWGYLFNDSEGAVMFGG